MIRHAYGDEAMSRARYFGGTHASTAAEHHWMTTKGLGYRIAAKFVPRLQSHDQKELPTEICQDLHQCALDDSTFMSRVITGDKT